jgi:phosphotriesterase-related protein
MTFVRTVLGDIPANQLGVCYAHEHIVIERSFVTQQNPDFLLADADRITAELAAFHAVGGRAMVDSMPCGAGRSAVKLAGVSQRSRVHILCPTGVHLAQYYPHGHWTESAGVELLATVFVDEIELGIDVHDTNGPIVERSTHRAGLIKVASGLDAIGQREVRIFEAAAAAHRRTGAPILTHTEQGTAGLAQVEMLMRLGVRPRSITLSHLDRKPDLGYHREVLSSGVFLEYDSAFRWKAGANPTRDLLVGLVAEGYAAQLMVGMDAARSRYWTNFGGSPGLSYLLEEFTSELRAAGWTDADFHTLFVKNPAIAYAFDRRDEASNEAR